MKATNLEVIDLSNNNLTGCIPPELSKLIYLRSLNLKRNKINGEIPRALSRCIQLRMLNLGENRMSGTIPDVLSSLKNLTVLNLQKNSFTGTIPPSVGLMYKLEILNFEYNKLTGDVPAAIVTMLNLRQLVLRYNKLSGVIPERLENLPDLEVLYLDHNQLTGPIPKRFGYLYKCRRINLSNNRLSGGIPESMNERDLSVVKECNFSSNNLSGELTAGLLSVILRSRARGMKSFDLTDNKKGFTLPRDIGKLAINVNVQTNSIPTTQTHSTSTGAATSSSHYATSIIGTPTNLINLDLSNLSLIGNFDDNLLKFAELNGHCGSNANCTLDLENNYLSGELPLQVVRFIAFSRQEGRKINLKGNKGFTLPSTLGQLGMELRVLDLSNCSLKKTIPHSIDHFPKGCDINLSNNQLSGELPLGVIKLVSKLKSSMSFFDSLAGLCNPGGYGSPGEGRAVKLENNLGFTLPRDMQSIGNDIDELDLSNCCIGGTLSESITHILDAKRIILDGNNFSSSMTVQMAEYICAMRERGGHFSIKNGGNISLPLNIGRLKNVGRVDLSDLSLDGSIPVSISLLEDRNFISFENNHLVGEMPIGMVKMVLKMRADGRIINLKNAGKLVLPEDLSSLPNLLIQEEYQLPREERKSYDDSSFTRSKGNRSPNKYYSILDLSNCSLTGQLPSSMCEMNKLGHSFNLVLTGNCFTGVIPLSLVRLTRMTSITKNFEEHNDSTLIDYQSFLELVVRDLSIGAYDTSFSSIETEIMTDPRKILWKAILSSNSSDLEETVRKICGKYGNKATKAKDEFGNLCIDVASAKMRLACATGLYYCWRYEVNVEKPLHVSENCIVLEAIDRKYENLLRDYYHLNLCQESRLHNYDVAEALVSINLIEKDKVNKLQQIPSNNEVSEDNFIDLCQKFIASNFSLELIPKVVLKFVKSNVRFTRELMVRSSNDFDSKLVVGFIKDDDERALIDAIEYYPPFQAAKYKAFEHVVVMQKTGLDLNEFLKSENLVICKDRVEHDRVVNLFGQLGFCIQHVHDKGVMHGNVSAFNILCQNGSNWTSDGNDSVVLIDFSSSGRLAPAKNSAVASSEVEYFGGSINPTMSLPPEAYYMLDPKLKGKDLDAYMAYWKNNPAWNVDLMGPIKGDSKSKSCWLPRVFAVEAVNMDGSIVAKNVSDLPYTLLPATSDVDIWAFGMLLFDTVADGKRRIKNFMKLRASTKIPLNPWPFWDDQDTDAMLAQVTTAPMLVELLTAIFRSDPSCRLRSMTDVLNHQYFTNVFDRVAPKNKTGTLSLYEVINDKRKKASESTVVVDGVPVEKFRRLLGIDRALRKSVFSSTLDFSTPTCIVILNRKVDKGVSIPGDTFMWKNIEWGKKIAAVLKAVKNLGQLPYYFDEDNDLSIRMDDATPEQEDEMTSRYEDVVHAIKNLINEDTEFWLYVVDEVTMDILPENENVGSPIRITRVDMVMRMFPLLYLTFKIIATERGMEGVAKILRIPCATVMGALSVEPCVIDISKFFIGDNSYNQDTAEEENKAQRAYDLLCKVGNSSNALLNNVWKVRMAPLNELDLLYAKSDTNFDGLRRMILSTGGLSLTSILGMSNTTKKTCTIFSRLSKTELLQAESATSANFTIGNASVTDNKKFSKDDYDFTEERSKSRAARNEIAELDNDHLDNGIPNEEFINILKEGITVTLYSLIEEKPPKEVKLKLKINNGADASITWKNVNGSTFKKSLTKKSLELSTLQAVEWGKTTPPLERAVDVLDEVCFSLIFVERSLDIKMENRSARNRIAKGFSKLMNSNFEDDPSSGFKNNVALNADEQPAFSSSTASRNVAIVDPEENKYSRIPSDFMTYMTKYENTGSSGKQHVANLCDDGTEFWNKWYSGSDSNGRTDHPTIRIVLEESTPVHRYSLRSANDCLERSPKSWSLFGIREGATEYELLHEVENEIFDAYWQTKHFVLNGKFENVMFDTLELRITEVQQPGSGTQLGMFYLSQKKNLNVGAVKTASMDGFNSVQPIDSLEVANQPNPTSSTGKGGGFGWAKKTSQIQRQDDALRAEQDMSPGNQKSTSDDITSWFGFGQSEEQRSASNNSPGDLPETSHVDDGVVWRPEVRMSMVHDRYADMRTYEDGELERLLNQSDEPHWTERLLGGKKEMKSSRTSYLKENPDSHSHLEGQVHDLIDYEPRGMPMIDASRSKGPRESYLSKIGSSSSSDDVRLSSSFRHNDMNNANAFDGPEAYDDGTVGGSENGTIYEGEVYEHEIAGQKYFVTNETDGLIYQWLSDQEVGDEIGHFEHSQPVWHASY